MVELHKGAKTIIKGCYFEVFTFDREITMLKFQLLTLNDEGCRVCADTQSNKHIYIYIQSKK